jgi:DNA-binding response OmpR family regulator
MIQPPDQSILIANAKGSVLVANTEPHFGAAIACYLEAQGWRVQLMSDAREPLERWDTFVPQLVVTDLEGSQIDGFEFLASLSAFPVVPRVLVLVPPAAATKLTGPVLAELGIDAVLPHPCRLDALERALAGLRRTRTEAQPIQVSSAEAASLARAVQ